MSKKSPSFEDALSAAIRAEYWDILPQEKRQRIQAPWVKWASRYVDQHWPEPETGKPFLVRDTLKKLWDRNQALAPNRILGIIGGGVFALRTGSWLKDNEWAIEQSGRNWSKVKKTFVLVMDGLSTPNAPISIPKDFDFHVQHARDDLELYNKHNFHTPGAVARQMVFFLIKSFTKVTGSPCSRQAALLTAVAFPEWKSAKSKSVAGLEDAAKKIWRSYKNIDQEIG